MSSKIHLMVLHPTYTFGGVERTMCNLVKGLSSDEFEITYMTSQKIAENLNGAKGIKEIVVIDGLGINIWYMETFKKDWFKDTVKICRIIKDKKPDMVLGLMYYAASILALGKLLGLLNNIKVISSPRGPMTPYFEMCHKEKTISNWLVPVSYRCFCWFSDALIVASNGMKKECIKLGARDKNVFVAPNSIDEELLIESSGENEWKNHAFFQDGFIIAASGRLTTEKDFALIIRAAERLIKDNYNVKLVIVGDGPDRIHYENLIKELNIENRALFTGFVKNPMQIFRLCHVFCHACLFEGFGNVLIEAMACGLPVISTDCPFGPSDIIDDGINGFLVPMGDVIRMSEKIRLLLDNQPLLVEMSQNAGTKGNTYTMDRMVKGYRDVFLRMIG